MTDESGSGFFGKGYWGRRVLWENVPVQHRTLDASGYLQRLLQAYGDTLEASLWQIAALPLQRDPYYARAEEGQAEWFYFTAAERYTDPVRGAVTRLIGERDPAETPGSADPAMPGPEARYPWNPYEPIQQVARWWRAILPTVVEATGEVDPTEYEVALVRTRNFDAGTLYDAARSLGNEVWVAGGDLTLPFALPSGWLVYGPTMAGVPVGLGDGTATPTVAFPGLQQRFAQGDGTIAGARVILDVPTSGVTVLRLYDVPDAPATLETGVLYREDPGAPGTLDLANPLGTVDYFGGAVSVDLTALGLLSHLQGTIRAFWQARGAYVRFLPPRVLDVLAHDYGFDNDRNDPEDRQRAAIAHLHQYFGCKGAQEAYRIRGEISLFNVRVQALWRVCDVELIAVLPPDHQFEYGGTYYSDLPPVHLTFDDIVGDEEYYDPDPAVMAWVTLLDRSLLYQDPALPSGLSTALAYAVDVTQGYYGPVSSTNPAWRNAATVESSTPLTSAEALAMGLPAGHRVVVRMQRCQADAFNFRKTAFGLTEYDKAGAVPPALSDPVFWIDSVTTPWTLDVAGATPEEDQGLWTVVIGVGLDGTGAPMPGPTVGGDVAVRYAPGTSVNCCWCPSYRVRVLIEPWEAPDGSHPAYDHYQTDAAMQAAVERMKGKIVGTLLPIHARVAEWVVTTEWSVFMGGVQGGTTRAWDIVDEFADLGSRDIVRASLEQRGDLAAGAQTQQIYAHALPADVPLTPPVDSGAVQSGVADPTTWYPVAGWVEEDITAAILSAPGDHDVRLHAVADASVTYGDVRWTFRVTRSTLG
jgi:hypothetical protein